MAILTPLEIDRRLREIGAKLDALRSELIALTARVHLMEHPPITPDRDDPVDDEELPKPRRKKR